MRCAEPAQRCQEQKLLNAALQLCLPCRNRIVVDVELLGNLSYRSVALLACGRHLALKAGVWFRRARLHRRS